MGTSLDIGFLPGVIHGVQVVPLLGDAIAQLRHDDLIDESFANKWLDTFLCLGHRSEYRRFFGGDLRLFPTGIWGISLDFPSIYWGNAMT